MFVVIYNPVPLEERPFVSFNFIRTFPLTSLIDFSQSDSTFKFAAIYSNRLAEEIELSLNLFFFFSLI